MNHQRRHAQPAEPFAPRGRRQDGSELAGGAGRVERQVEDDRSPLPGPGLVEARTPVDAIDLDGVFDVGVTVSRRSVVQGGDRLRSGRSVVHASEVDIYSTTREHTLGETYS